MKKLSLIVLCYSWMSFSNDLLAQTNTVQSPPSDAPTGYTYDFDSAKKLIIERQIKPGQNNKDVQPIIDSKDFPKLKNEKALDAAYHESLKEWMEKNPNTIIETLKSRKEIVQKY